MEVSYFINNTCNLKCKHCYVGYNETSNELSIDQWIDVFDKLIELGALTFGNVGKEPLLNSEKTISLLRHLANKRKQNPKLRFGFVTNGTLLTTEIIKELAEILPDYIDISLDGTEEAHDFIRGKGNYSKTIENLKKLPKDLANKVFISYTLMEANKDSFKKMISVLSSLGFKKFLVSPYVQTPNSNGELSISDKEVADFYKRIIKGEEIYFSKLNKILILLKSDYDANKSLIALLVQGKVIDLKKLFIDEYGVIFNRYPQLNESQVILNYMPISDTLSRAIRISHDGYVGGCLEMFHSDYPKRAKANLREKPIEEILMKH